MKEKNHKKHTVDMLLKLMDGYTFRFVISGMRFPNEFDVKHVLKRHVNNKHEIEFIKDKQTLNLYGNIKEGGTNKLVNDILEKVGQKELLFHDNTYDIRTYVHEAINDMVIQTPTLIIQSYNINDMSVVYTDDGYAREIKLTLGEDNKTILTIFDIQKQKEFKPREHQMLEKR